MTSARDQRSTTCLHGYVWGGGGCDLHYWVWYVLVSAVCNTRCIASSPLRTLRIASYLTFTCLTYIKFITCSYHLHFPSHHTFSQSHPSITCHPSTVSFINFSILSLLHHARTVLNYLEESGGFSLYLNDTIVAKDILVVDTCN